MKHLSRLALSALVTCCAAHGAQAGDWQQSLTPYLWGSGMSGKTAIGTSSGPIEADVDVSFGDILENLKMGAMLSYRADHDKWTVLGDFIYMNLAADKGKDVGPLRINGAADVKQTALEGDLGYRVAENTIAFAGLRYNDIDADIDVRTSGPGEGQRLRAGTSESWVDPIIGVLTQIPLRERWSLGLRGDIGGFGVGSDFAWQVIATVRWQANDKFDVVGGYRYLDVDYEQGHGASQFKYDMTTSGPGIGATYKF